MENIKAMQTEQGTLTMQDLDTMDVSIMLLSQRLARLENLVKKLALQADVEKLMQAVNEMKQFGELRIPSRKARLSTSARMTSLNGCAAVEL